MASQYSKINGVFDATPLTRSLRQEVEGFDVIICLMELIDNAVEATLGRAEPCISIHMYFDKVDEDGRPTGQPAELIIEDNGKGMSQHQLAQYFRVSYTTSRIPTIDRDSNPGVLPLDAFINRKLNRFGRGSASVVYFGDLVEIESFQGPRDPSQPSHAYMIKCDYGALLRTNSWALEMFEKDQEVVEDDLNSWTIIRISQLLPDKERVLRDVASLEQLAKKLQQVYHWFIYGVPEWLWDKLPADLTRGCNRPTGGLKIEMMMSSGSEVLFQVCLSQDAEPGGGPGGGDGYGLPGTSSNLQAVLREWAELAKANNTLEPCVTCMRYLPPGHPSTGAPGAGSKSGNGVFTGISSDHGSLSSTMGRGRESTRLGSGRGRGGGRGGRGGGLPPRPPEPGSSSLPSPKPEQEVIELLDEDTDIDNRQKDCVCDFVLIWLFFPYRACARSKPFGDGGEELFVFPFWSGKDMVKSKLHATFPDIYKAAVALARSDQEVQNHAHKLEDPGRLVALLLVSPDALAHQHKSDFEGKAYELFCKAGPSDSPTYRPSSDAQPRLMTYVWAKDLEGAAEDDAVNGDGNGGTMNRRRRSSTAFLAGASPRRPPPLPRLGHPGWYEDSAGGWAAQQLLAAFHTWFLTDEDGHLVPPTELVELTTLDLLEPHGFNLMERGMKECSDKYMYGEGDAVEVGEMLMVVSINQKRIDDTAAGGSGARAAGGGPGGGGKTRIFSRYRAGHGRLAEKFFIEGTDAAKQHYALVRPWRPHWSPRAPLLSESIVELQPLIRGGKRLVERKAEQKSLINRWESFLPRRLVVQPDEQIDAIRPEYDINQTLNTITIFIAGNGPETDGGGAGGSGAAGGAGGGGTGRGRGRPNKAAQTNMATNDASVVEAPPACVTMSKIESHYPKYTVTVSLVIERWKSTGASSGKGSWEVLKTFNPPHIKDKCRFTFTGFGDCLRQLGKYRLRFQTVESPVELLDPKRPLEVVFQVTNSQPVALDAFFVEPGRVAAAAAAGAEPTPLSRAPIVRLGEIMPDLAVSLVDAQGGRVALPPEMLARLSAPWDPAAAATVGTTSANTNANGRGGGSGNPLGVTAEVVDGDALKLNLRLVKRGGIAGPSGSGRSMGLSFSPDNSFLFISGLLVKPTALKQTIEGGGKGNVPSLRVRLKLVLEGKPQLSTGLATTPVNGAAGNGVANVRVRELQLVSGPPHSINVENGNWFNNSTPDRPLTLSKGAELDNNLDVRLVDASGNPFFLNREPRPRVELRCSRLNTATSPPVMVRKQPGPSAGVGVGGGRGGGARSEFVESVELELDSSGNFLTLPGSLIKATGLPGDIGTLSMSLVGSGKQTPLMSYVSVRKVVLGVEERAGPEGEGVGGGSGRANARGRTRAKSQPAHGHVREYLLDGTINVKARRELRWADLEALPDGVDEGGKSLLEGAFERRVEFTSAGPREVFLRPSGCLLRSQEEVLAAALDALVSPDVLYEQCFVLRPGQLRLTGLRLSLSDEADDVVDELLAADVRILIGSRDALTHRLRFEKGRVDLPDLVLEEKDFAEATNAVVGVSVCDSEGRVSGAAGNTGGGSSSAAVAASYARPFCYGTFYVRQEPHAVALRLAPLSCDLLTNRRAVTPWPPLPAPPPAVEGVLRLPAVLELGPAGGAASAAPTAAAGRQQSSLRAEAEAAGSLDGGGGAQPGIKSPQFLLQLLPLRSGADRGKGAPAVDAAALMSRGFSLATDCITVQAGQTLHVPVAAVDQMGFPLPIPPALARLLEQYTLAYLEPVKDAAAAAEVVAAAATGNNAHGGHGRSGGGGAGGRGTRSSRRSAVWTGSAVSSLVPCEIRGWTWHGEAPGDGEGGGPGAVGAETTQEAPQLPVCYFQVQPVHPPGHAALIITFDPPADAPDAADFHFIPRLHMGLVLNFKHGPLAPGGYQLTVREPEGLQAEPVSEHPERKQELQELLPIPTTCQRIYVINVVEKTKLMLVVRLMDAQSCPVMEDGIFESRFLDTTYQVQAQQYSVTRGMLKLHVPVGAGAACLADAMLLLLTPISPNFVQGGPLCIYLVVRRGRYPVEPLELVWSDPVHLPTRGEPLRLALSNEGPPTSRHRNGNDFAAATPWPYLPAFHVLVHSADGMKLEADELQPLRLFYAQRAQVDGQLVLQDAPDQPVKQLQARDPSAAIHRAHFYAAAGAVEIPTRAGQVWTLMAVYEDPRVDLRDKRLGPLRILDLEVLPAPPFRIQLGVETEAALGPLESRVRAVVLANEALNEYMLPAMQGHLVDRWGNASMSGDGHLMVLTARTCNSIGSLPLGPSQGSGPGPSEGMALIELASCELDPQSGCFQLPATDVGAVGLIPGTDYEVWLQLWYSGAGPSDIGDGGGDGVGFASTGTEGGGGAGDEHMAGTEDAAGAAPAPPPLASAGGAGSAIPGVELLVRTLYVSLMGDSAALRTKVQQLQAEVSGQEQRLRIAASEEETRRRAAGEAAAQCGRVLTELYRRGVRLPEAAAAAVRGQMAESATAAQSELQGLLEALERSVALIDQQVSRLMQPPLVETATLARWQQPQPAAATTSASTPSFCLLPFMARGNTGHPTNEATHIYNRLRQMALTCVGVEGALGPLVMLGAVEKGDVAIALGQLAGGRFERVFVLNDGALREVVARLRNMRPGGSATDLRDPVLLHRYDLDAGSVDTSHPQLPLWKRPLRSRFQNVLNFDVTQSVRDVEQILQPGPPKPQQQQPQSNKRNAQQEDGGGLRAFNDHGFIGFAVNLVHLPPHLADIRIPLQDKRGQVIQATLRQTMFNYVFGNAMVFEKEEHINAFKDRCRRSGLALDVPLIAVDGRGGYNLHDKGSVSFGERVPPHVCFSGVPREVITQLSQDGAHAGALDPRLRAEQCRLVTLHSHKAQLQSLRPQLEAAFADLSNRQQMAEDQAAQCRTLRSQLLPQLDDLRNELQSCTAEMERLAQRERSQAAQRRGPVGGGPCEGGNAGTVPARRGRTVRFGRGSSENRATLGGSAHGAGVRRDGGRTRWELEELQSSKRPRLSS